ncbi:E3 ubiquitin-protein ligase NRDP1-like [Sorex araneus]|uniref:E3 ubiquitin-protein ligase NRDP1-like n=1 Tax=Sorex araneus TaxID=42254 RepID=UPI002433A877|nr:E3 ubiquitin-protein ligase NRDP1-like [Sorex araneus]
MGYDVTRFIGELDEDLICPICSGILEDPVQALHCEHAFCKACINHWFSQQHTCPVDRNVLTFTQLCPVPRIMQKMLSKLMISCTNAVFGCRAVVQLANLKTHLRDCEHNPKQLVTCAMGCSLVIAKDELPQHNCIEHLHSRIQQQHSHILELEKTSAEQKHQLVVQKRDIQALKAYLRTLCNSETHLHNLEVTVEHNDILQWVNSLQPAKVNHWDGVISTPDNAIQALIKRSLVDSGCPASIINQLIENCHEWSWPQGLATLEIRELNQHYYENFVARHIPGLQAVAVMASENQHMSENMVLEPGIVMIFAHGVEDLLEA